MKRLRLAPFRRKAHRATGRFRRDTRGVAAIEFALVVGPFLVLALGTIEVALIHLMRSSVSNAVEAASRPIYTGAAGCATVQSVKEEICTRISIQSNTNCQANLKVVLEELSGFNGQRLAVDTEFDDITNFVDPGASESTMLLRTYYRWDVLFPMMDQLLGGGNGELLLNNSTAFKNEPFGTNTGCSA